MLIFKNNIFVARLNCASDSLLKGYVDSLYKTNIYILSIFRLKREREERRLQQSANPRGTISLTVNATDLFTRYQDEYEL